MKLLFVVVVGLKKIILFLRLRAGLVVYGDGFFRVKRSIHLHVCHVMIAAPF